MEAPHQRPILVVEDDEDCRAALAESLREEGHLVVDVANGKAALEYLVGGSPEPALIFLDLRMPTMTGREMLEVSQSYLRLSKIPVVIVSGEPEGDGESYPGVVARLNKPYDLAAVRAIVASYVGPPKPVRPPTTDA